MTTYYLNKKKTVENFESEKLVIIFQIMGNQADPDDFSISMSPAKGIVSITIYDDRTVHKGRSLGIFEDTIRKFGYKGKLLKVKDDSGPEA